MIAVAIGFLSGGFLLLTLGFLIRNRGMTWLVAGYDPAQVRDERGLANWVGGWLLAMGGLGMSAGALVYALPAGLMVVPVLLYAVGIPTGAFTILIGLNRYVK